MRSRIQDARLQYAAKLVITMATCKTRYGANSHNFYDLIIFAGCVLHHLKFGGTQNTTLRLVLLTKGCVDNLYFIFRLVLIPALCNGRAGMGMLLRYDRSSST